MNTPFNYDLAFSRNIGWVTETEQHSLKTKRIAIAGLGGVGGSHLLTLTRLGIGKFNIADLDIFEIPNFNRQVGATVSHLNRPKVDVMSEMSRDINPELEIKAFAHGINLGNMDDFLSDVDLYVDGLDFFATDAREAVFAACAEKGIPALTAAPLGMGVSLLCFMPGKMTFEDYFQWQGQSQIERLLRFMVGLTPAMLQMKYLVDHTRMDLANHKGPSTAIGCELCSSMISAHAIKILLGRGEVNAVPVAVHFDAYRNKFIKTWRPWGNKNPLQQISLKIARKRLSDTINK